MADGGRGSEGRYRAHASAKSNSQVAAPEALADTLLGLLPPHDAAEHVPQVVGIERRPALDGSPRLIDAVDQPGHQIGGGQLFRAGFVEAFADRQRAIRSAGRRPRCAGRGCPGPPARPVPATPASLGREREQRPPQVGLAVVQELRHGRVEVEPGQVLRPPDQLALDLLKPRRRAVDQPMPQLARPRPAASSR